jgi:transcriptional regulator with XRE-family HTH domain
MPDGELPHPRRARLKRRLRVSELAALTGLLVPAICRYERKGTYPVHHDLRAKYLRALGLAEVKS